MDQIITDMSREELENEITRLRNAANASKGLAAQVAKDRTRREGSLQNTLDSSHAATAQARADADSHKREFDAVSDSLAESQNVIAALNESRSALAISEARQRAIFESAIDFAMVITDRDGMITDWNSGAEYTMGWTAQEMRGQSANRFFTSEDRAEGRINLEMQLALKNGRASDERWHLRKDGQRFWASGEMMPLLDEAGAHLGYVKIMRDRTDEHLAGIELKVTQERYRLAARATNDAVWDWDLATNRVLWNEALERSYGHNLSETERTGDWWISQIHPDDRSRIDRSIHAVIESGDNSWTDNYRFQRADKSYASVLDRGHVIRDVNGLAVRMIGAMLDLSRMRLAEEALKESQERFRTTLDVIDVAFAIVKVKFDADDTPVDYRFLEANPAFERQAGVNLRGKWVTEFAPDLEKFWFETYGHVAKTGEPITFENYAKAFNRWFDVRAVRIGDPADRQIAILFNDTTQRREAEERLRVSEAIARENVQRVQLALAAGAIIGTWHWDIPSDRFTVDEGFALAFGLDPALGRSGLSLDQVIATVHPDDREGLTEAINDVIGRGGAYAHQYRVKRSDGQFYWIEANGRVDFGPDGKAQSFPGVLIDVEDRRAVEAERDRASAALRALNDTLEQRVTERTNELMQAEERLRQSQKMEAVGQLTGGLAHDFNNLLAGISGSLELMNNRIGQGRFRDIEKYMVAAQGAAKRAAALTHRLLAFSRRQTLDPKPTDVNVLSSEMLDLIQRTVGPGIFVEFIGQRDLWSVLVDASQLENALLNLCINARDAMPAGGRITIETSHLRIEGIQAQMRDLSDGQYLVLSVSDNGSGMPPDVVARAFEPFFTTKPTGEGTGLGLSMIYGFAKQSGGQVRIHSVVDKGTTISIYLPRFLGAGETQERASDAVSLPVADFDKTILVVDDEPTVRMLVMDVMQDLGYSVLEAADGNAGLKVLQSNTRIDLLITDVGLPGGMNGRQMADAARLQRHDLKVLFITGFAESALIKDGQLDPGMAIVTKPFTMDALTSRARELLALTD